jgi:hypothetical protein
VKLALAPRDLEAAARTALEDRAGKRLTDEEWEHAKQGILALFSILKDSAVQEPTSRRGTALNTCSRAISPNAATHTTVATPPVGAVVSLAVSPESG